MTIPAKDELTESQKNWKKFWKIMKLMPLWFILPFTAFFKMQEVLAGKDPADVEAENEQLRR